MVNKTLKNIDFLLKNKQQINDSELAYLFDLTVKYPFSSFCHYVVFSVLKKQNRTGYENMLKKTAIRFHNRIYLEQLASNLNFNFGKETEKNMDKKIHKNEDYPSEDVKTLNENIYGNLIAENIIHEVEETQTNDDLIVPKIVDKNTPKSFEDWLFKETIPTTSKK